MSPRKKTSAENKTEIVEQKATRRTRVKKEVVSETSEAVKEPKENKAINNIKEAINVYHDASTVSGIPFEYHGMRFVALTEMLGGVLSISADILESRMRFHDNNETNSNDWRKSTIRKKLNHDVINKFNTDDMIPIVSDLTADTGEDEYGTCEDWIALPSDSMLRKFNKIIPSYNTWIWSITPWAVKYSTMSAVSARTQSKTIYSEQPNKELGVAIVCIFRKEVIGL